MSPNTFKEKYQGNQYTIVHCKDTLDSLNKALKSVRSAKAKSLQRQLVMQIERLANGGRMTNEHFPPEGNLPENSIENKFRALKRLPIRGYCWYSTKHPNTWFISHYIYKDQQKLDVKDTRKVLKNWKRIEEADDER